MPLVVCHRLDLRLHVADELRLARRERPLDRMLGQRRRVLGAQLDHQLRHGRVDVSRADTPEHPVLVQVDGHVTCERRHSERCQRPEGVLHVERRVQHLARTREEVHPVAGGPRIGHVVDHADGERDRAVGAAHGVRAHDRPALLTGRLHAVADHAFGRLAAERAAARELLDGKRLSVLVEHLEAADDAAALGREKGLRALEPDDSSRAVVRVDDAGRGLNDDPFVDSPHDRLQLHA